METIQVNPDLRSQAQAVCNDMGLDIVTVIDYFLKQIVQREPNSLQVVYPLITKGKPAKKLGGWEGKIKMADDFNAPMDDFYEPTGTLEERRAIVDSLIGSIDDPTFVEPPEIETPDAPRNWELMDL